MTGGGADYCFECAGKASLMEEAYTSCRKVSLYSSPSIYLSIYLLIMPCTVVYRQTKNVIKIVPALQF